MEIIRLSDDDFERLMQVKPGLFDNPVDPEQARAFLADPLHEMVLAYDQDQAVGMASGSVLLHPDKDPAMFIAEVGTRDGYTRRGIATALTDELIRIARARGCKSIWLGTETDNHAAIGLYRKLGGDEITGVFFGWDGAFDED